MGFAALALIAAIAVLLGSADPYIKAQDKVDHEDNLAEMAAWLADGKSVWTLNPIVSFLKDLLDTYFEFLNDMKTENPMVYNFVNNSINDPYVFIPGLGRIQLHNEINVLDFRLDIPVFKGFTWYDEDILGGTVNGYYGFRFTQADRIYISGTDEFEFDVDGTFYKGSSLTPPIGIGLVNITNTIISAVIMTWLASKLGARLVNMIDVWYKRKILGRTISNIIDDQLSSKFDELYDNIDEILDAIGINKIGIDSISSAIGLRFALKKHN